MGRKGKELVTWIDEYSSHLPAFPGGSEGKASACNAGDLPGSIPGSGRSLGEGKGNPLQYSCLESPMDREALVGYSPRGCKESDMTEQFHFPTFLPSCRGRGQGRRSGSHFKPSTLRSG